MKKVLRVISTLMCIALLITSFPMSGFAKAVDEATKSQPTVSENGKLISYSKGETEESLRMPVETDSSIEPTVTGKLVEVNQYSKVYKTGDKTYSTVYTPTPNFYLDKSGKEHEYDNSLKLEGKASSGEFTNKSSDIDVSLSTNLAKKGMTFEYDGVKVGLTPAEGCYDTYLISDNAVRYNNVFDGIDVQYTIEETGIREFIILNHFVEKSEFTYKLNTNGNTVKLIDNVLHVYKGNDTENCIYTISAPIMTDAAGVESNAVNLDLKKDTITIAADSKWLAAPERAYPVYIDPDVKRVDTALSIRTVVEDGDRVYAADNYARGYAGYIEGQYFSFSGVLGRSKILVHIADNQFYDLPEGAGIIDATLNIYQYVSPSSSTKFICSEITDSWSLSDYNAGQSKAYTKASKLNVEFLSSSSSKVGWHKFDIRTAVVNWVNGFDKQNGLMIAGQFNDKSEKGGAFITNTSEGAAGAGAYANEKPYIIINWEIPNPVDPNYPLDNTTINLRTIGTSSRDGKLAILGVFADGVAKPNSIVNYVFSDTKAENQTNATKADVSYKYPDSTAWNSAFASQGRATKYKDILSNWQTAVPFTKFEFNKVYNWTATASFEGAKGKSVKSPDYLVYKITRYDTLNTIAKYYGVSVDKLATDNHVQDMLLVENNTIIVINPTQNATVPYNPAPLTDAEKAKIDGLLIGRAKHCEFGFEPVNLNTGNFYMSQTDISIPDYNGNFEIARSYNSKESAINSAFGRGWQFDYAESLAKLENGDIAYHRGDGSTVCFSYSGGKYVCTPGYYLELSPISVGTKEGDFGGEKPEKYTVYEYEIKDAEGEVRRFSSRGLLTSVKDKKGFTTTLNYDDSANITSIVSPAGATYMLSWDSMGRVTQIVVPNGSNIKYSYDDAGNLSTYTNEVGDVVHYNYDSNHRMTSWSDGENNTIITNVYDSEGRVTKQTDSEGNVTILNYGSGYTESKDANGNVTKYNYDDQYRTTSVEYADGSKEYKYYDSANNLSKSVDRSGNATEYKYNSDGLTTEIKRFDGKTQTFTYDSNNNVTKSTDFDGKSINCTYDSKSNMLSMTKKDGSVEKYEYDDNCRLIKLTDANGNKTEYKYDNVWVSKIIDAKGNETQLYYNANGQVVTKIDALNNTTRYLYDAAGKNLGYQLPDNSTVSYTYDRSGCLKTLKNANGYVYSYEYDGIGNITKLIDPLSNEVIYEYDGLYNNTVTAYDKEHKTLQSFDAFSQVITSTDEENNKTTYSYDKSENVISVKDPKGNVTKYTYDLRFNKITSMTDALGNKTTYTYDDIGNLIKMVDANGAATEYAYDAVGNVVKITYANGLIVNNTYDKVGNLTSTKSNAGENTSIAYDKAYNVTSITYSNGAKLEYTYDANSQKLTEKDSAGAVTKYTYDTLGRKSSVEDAVGRKTVYAYDGNGNLLSETNSNGGITRYSYDALDRVRQVIDALGNSTFLEYDNVGNMISSKNAAEEVTKYQYNKVGLVTKTTDPLNGVLTYTYDANGNLIHAKDAGGYEAAIAYDALNRTSSTTDALGLTTTFTYDAVGNLVKESNNNGLNNAYSYDKVNNLVEDKDSLGNATAYTYDLNGNLLTVTAADKSVTSYTYNTLGNVTSMTNALKQKTEFEYDLVGNLTSKKLPNGGSYTYSYDKVGRTTLVVDPENQKTAYEYNEFDEITKVTDANGNIAKSEYDIGGNLISETDQNGNATKYTYDNVYRLISAVYANGTTNKIAYDANGNVISATDANGNTTKYKNDALGNAVEVTDANGGVTKYAYDGAGNVLSETNALGATTKYSYDISGQLTKKVLANSATYTYTYDALGRTVKESQPEGLSTEYKYDSVGNTVAKIDQSGRTTSYSYDLLHRITSAVDAMGNESKLTYDVSGNLATLTSPKGNVTTYTYDKVDRLTKATDPTKATETYTYDGVGNVLSSSLNGKRTTSYSYDKVGNLKKVTNALGNKKSYTYDSVNRLSAETDYKGKSIAYTYDGNGNIKTLTDRRGNATKYAYDKLDNLLSEIDAEGRNKKYTYDAIGQLTSVTEADTATSTYEYDSVGNLVSAGGYKYDYNLNGELTSSKDALGNVTEYIYNANGMLKTVKNADGSTVDYDYDKIDELISKKYDGTEDVALYGYDADGNRVSMSDIAGTTDYEYDENGKVTAIKLYDGKSKITYTYNEFGELSKLGYPDGKSVSYEYDKLGQLVSITNRDGLKTAYKYDANGNVTEVHRPNNTYTEIKYNENDQVSKLTNYLMTNYFFVFRRSSVVTEYEYEYDKSGNIVKEDYRDFSTYGEKGYIGRLILKLTRVYTEFNYKYDGRNQLVSEVETQHKLFKRTKLSESTYKYDVSGNRIQDSVKGKVTNYTYNEAGQLVKKTTGKEVVTYTYDANGNLIKEANNGKLCAKYSKTFTYNNENKLTAVMNNKKLLMAALYDGDNERLFVVSDREGCGMPCVNDKNCSNLKKNEDGIEFDEELIKNTMLIPNNVDCSLELSQYDFTGYINNINSEYTQVLMEFGANNKICATYEYGVFRESAEIDGKDYFYEYDGRGSVSALANSNGKERESYKYDPYGNVTTSGLDIANPYQYNAEYVDDATDYQYLRARYYRAETGSFITADTYAGNITNPLSLNRYTYTHNNPINGKDPNGHFFLTAMLITAVVAVTVTAVSYGVKKSNEKKLANTNAQINETNNQRVSAESNATSVVSSNSSVTSIKGNSVNYKNKVYYFKTAEEALQYHTLCEKLDKLEKDKAKYENNIKIANIVQKAGIVTAGVALTVASGGMSNMVLAGALSGAGIAATSNVVSQTMSSDGSLYDKLGSDIDYKDLAISTGTGAVTGMISGRINQSVTAKGSDLALKVAKKISPSSQVGQKVIGRGLTGLVSGAFSSGSSNIVNQSVDIITGEADKFDWKEFGTETLTGAGVGGGLGALGGYIEGKTIKKKIADNRAIPRGSDNKANRGNTVGGTPSKDSRVGREVFDRQVKEGTARINKDTGIKEFLDPTDIKKGITDNWLPVDETTQMGHIHGAAEWWADGGYKFGAKSPEAKAFMKNPSNYRLEYGPSNASNGRIDKKIYGYFK